MEKVIQTVMKAIEDNVTLISKHYYCDIVNEPVTLEVFPYKIDGDFLVCYDLASDQISAINMKKIVTIVPTGKKYFSAPKQNLLK